MNSAHNYLSDNPNLIKNTQRTLWVIFISLVTMIAEIFAGYWSGSMALLADGWHMASHLAALLITYFAYKMAIAPQMVRHFNFGGGKIIPLGGYTSALLLGGISLLIGYESINRLIHPVSIHFTEAITVASIGLLVNLVCALILREQPHSHAHPHNHEHHHHHHGHDHNMRGAYLHVVADALTSVAAIIALVISLWQGWLWMDAIVGMVSALVILKWSFTLVKDTGWELLDGHAKGLDYQKIKDRIECEHVEIIDLHVWTIAPNTHACELVVLAKHIHGIEYYRSILKKEFSLEHIVVEERLADDSAAQPCR